MQPRTKRRRRPRATTPDSANGQHKAGLAGSTHVTRGGGNVFADLGFPAGEAENLKMRSRLMTELCDIIAEKTQIEAAAMLGVSQPRVSDLVRGKIGLFTIDALVNMLAHGGVRLRVSAMRHAARGPLQRK
jgi:predicted XRE-type DNA-binding protein